MYFLKVKPRFPASPSTTSTSAITDALRSVTPPPPHTEYKDKEGEAPSDPPPFVEYMIMMPYSYQIFICFVCVCLFMCKCNKCMKRTTSACFCCIIIVFQYH